MSYTCRAITQDIHRIRALKQQYDAAVTDVLAGADVMPALILKTELVAAVKAVHEEWFPYGSPEFTLGKIRAQYEAQAAMWAHLGVTQRLANGEAGIDIDGVEYPMPSLRTIERLLREREPALNEKVNQGFTKLLLVPFAMKTNSLVYVYGEALKWQISHGGLKAPKENPDEPDVFYGLNTRLPVVANRVVASATTVYYPRQFNPANHRGQTKAEVLADLNAGGTPGWQVILVEQFPNIPRANYGQVVGGRKQLEAGRTPEDYLAVLGRDVYIDEVGLTPEDWLSLAITNVTTNGAITEDILGKGAAAQLLGAYYMETQPSGSVPSAYWYRTDHLARLDTAETDISLPDCGTRSAVRLVKFGSE